MVLIIGLGVISTMDIKALCTIYSNACLLVIPRRFASLNEISSKRVALRFGCLFFGK